MDHDETEFVRNLMAWLDQTQSHLDDQSRRRLIELMVTEHIAKLRNEERARRRGRDFLLWFAVGGSIITMLTNAAPFLAGLAQ